MINVDAYFAQIGLSESQRHVWTSFVRDSDVPNTQVFQSIYSSFEPTAGMWQPNQPDDYAGREDCVESSKTGLNDITCSGNSHNYRMTLCEYSTS